jgi:uncharacterized RDD family membrane protein YckC
VALICSLIVVFLVYPTTVETLTRGKSLGKLVLGLRVVRDDGGTSPPTRRSSARWSRYRRSMPSAAARRSSAAW